MPWLQNGAVGKFCRAVLNGKAALAVNSNSQQMKTRQTKILGLALLIAGVVLCGAGLWVLSRLAQYQASVQISLNPGGNDAGLMSYDPYFIQIEFEIIQSDVVLGKVVEALNLNIIWGQKYGGGGQFKSAETMGLLKRRMNLRQSDNRRLIEISVTSEDPVEAAKIANAIAEAYDDFRVKQLKLQVLGGIKALEESYKENEQDIKSKQDQVDRLRSKLRNADVPDETDPGWKPYTQASQELNSKVEFHKLLAKKIESEKLEAGMPTPTDMIQITSPAIPPTMPIGPDRSLGVLFVIGLFPTVGGFLLLKSSFRQSE